MLNRAAPNHVDPDHVAPDRVAPDCAAPDRAEPRARRLWLGYTGGLLDRQPAVRHDAARAAALAADPAARAYVVAGELVVLRRGVDLADPLFTLAEAERLAPPHERVWLGLDGTAGRFGVGIDPAAAEALAARPDLMVTDLRSIAVQGLVAGEHLPALAAVKALLLWHARHRFCSACGSPSALADAGWRRRCPACGADHFPRTDPVVIMLAVDGDRCLLGRQARFAPGMWSCLAGFVEPGESIEEAVRRETLEEAGIRCGRVGYAASQPWPFPMSLMIGCYAEALSTDLTIDRTELEDLRWFGRDEAAAMLARRHPDGLTTPPPIAIGHALIRGWVEGIATG
ncbi:NADH pyrophosphatase [Rhodoplanes serenus]|uniref:NAD(+) diphosphatase n=1 Tax=Rhodoplanes serenus TaxID=200615 RepID=A0A3S4DGU2_9BRAD|nr:NAD(+) diphosphatase [Rhodoplanes serenus]VCU10052.1 NADH pyrophosphatase [Rhodoplanes serenus]